MALDGMVIACMADEMKRCMVGGRITKIAQPEPDALMLTIKNQKDTRKLFLSAGASLPLVYFTEETKPNPMTAPGFCMLLRKHIGGGRILSVTQPGLERILRIEIEHLNEMGDTCRKFLIAEFMGKHSNLIFTGPDETIIDSIKHIPPSVSSVRAVLPGFPYFIPETQDKQDPFRLVDDFDAAAEAFISHIQGSPAPLARAVYTYYTGLSPLMAEELCYLASLDSSKAAGQFQALELSHLLGCLRQKMEDIRSGQFSPCMIMDGTLPIEFAAFGLCHLTESNAGYTQQDHATISEVLNQYYASRETYTRIRQKSTDLRRIVQTALDRNRKKYDLQLRQLKDTEKKDRFRIYGELINTYGYQSEANAKQLEALNYYTNEMITIPLDPDLTAQENAQRYFEKYNKMKRTAQALGELTTETDAEIRYLESVSEALNIASSEDDLIQIKEELRESGYVKKRSPKDKKVRITSRPLHYLSSDGYDIYVGKNNLQNEALTFQLATGNDLWFHAKGIPGSHVIVRTGGKPKEALPDRLFEEAGSLAAYYSKGRNAEKTEIDYIEKKQIRKVNGAKPGFVIYHSNYSMVAAPDISHLVLTEDT